jgi:predicted PurR-regulated permease PerM
MAFCLKNLTVCVVSDLSKLLPKAAIWALFVVVASRVVISFYATVADLVVLCLSALFVSFALDPAVSFMERHRIRRGLATFITLFGVIGFIAGLLFAAGAVALSQADSLASAAPGIIRDAASTLNDALGTSLDPDTLLAPGSWFDSTLSSVKERLLDAGSGILASLGALLTLLFLSFYFTSDSPRLRRAVCSFFPPERQQEVRRIFDTAVSKTGDYLFSRFILSIVSAFTHAVLFASLSVPYAVPLGIWVGVVSQIIPVLGTYLAAGLPLIIALGDNGFKTALFVAIAVTIYQQIENNVLSPKITRSRLDIHPVVSLLAVIVGARLAGAPGALLAIPLVATLSALSEAYVKRHEVYLEDATKDTTKDTTKDAES